MTAEEVDDNSLSDQDIPKLSPKGFDYKLAYDDETFLEYEHYLRIAKEEHCSFCNQVFSDQVKLYTHAPCYFLRHGKFIKCSLTKISKSRLIFSFF